jgi:hypothetical protein
MLQSVSIQPTQKLGHRRRGRFQGDTCQTGVKRFRTSHFDVDIAKPNATT